MNYALISIGVNAAMSLALFPFIGFIAVAVATSFAAWLQVVLLGMRLFRLHLFRPSAALIGRFARILVAAGLMSAFLLFALSQTGLMAEWVWGREWVVVLALSAAGGTLYGVLALALGAARLADYKTGAGGK
jgi:putative peptidoglycan lipid II flippase